MITSSRCVLNRLLALRDWLEALGVRKVAMEATGVYWKRGAGGHVRTDARQRPACQSRAGRKTDIKDAQWLCELLEAGLLRASFVPPKPIRTLRNLTRYRKTQIQDRSREAARLHKMLEDAGIKLSSVATDIIGKSGRDVLDALVAGTTDPSCSLISRAGCYARGSPRCRRRWKAGSAPSTR